MKNDCFFCNKLFYKNGEAGISGEESIIYQDSNVMVFPDISPLAIGHVLVVSKLHYPCYGLADEETLKSLTLAINYITGRNSSKDWVVFEHGSVFDGRGGSSIEHAHMHILPLKLDLLKLVKDKIDITIEYGKMEYIYDLAKKGQSYIYLFSSESGSTVIPVEGFPSQFLRMVIAQYSKVNYDWHVSFNTLFSKDLFNKTFLYYS